MSQLLPEEYGVIANGRSAAVISRLGSIDWLCLPQLDSPSHFAALLDENRGGKFQLVPEGDFRSEQRYLQRTLVLETVFETPNGRAVLTDWMPSDAPNGRSDDPPSLRRTVEVIDGKIRWRLHCAPRFDYGTHPGQAEFLHRADGESRSTILFRGSSDPELAALHSSLPLEISAAGNTAVARFDLEAGASAEFRWDWGLASRDPGFEPLRKTVEAWHSRAHRCDPGGCLFAGPWHDSVARSDLFIQALQNEESGSLAESVTTSVSATPGGSRNWDFRYAWLRDSSRVMSALDSLGRGESARMLFCWIADILDRDGTAALQPVYQLNGGRFLPERELGTLNGYRGSRPVRIGNFSSRQFQLDVHGHVLLAAETASQHPSGLPEKVLRKLWPKLAEVADTVCQAWKRPDHGPWESRSKPEHYVASKALCWAALDRAISLAPRLGEEAPGRWKQELSTLHRTICEQGFDLERQSFVRAFGDREVDASALELFWMGFLPSDDPRMQGTLHAIQEDLSEGVLLQRARHSEFSATGPAGAYLSTSFRYAATLAACGRTEEAVDRLAELCTFATPLGIFCEQADPASGRPGGNFPSGSAHISLVHAAAEVGRARARMPSLVRREKTKTAAAASIFRKREA